MSRLLGLGACQMQSVPGDIQANLDALDRHIKTIKFYSPWVKLVCAPELVIPGMADMETMAQPIPGPATEACADLAKSHNIYLIPGSIFERQGEKIYNTAPVFDPDGHLIATYRKMYPWRPHEKTVSGDRTVTFEMPGIGVVGLCICYDVWFPEVIRDLVWKGAEVILVPTFTGTQDRQQELIIGQAVAAMNQCYLVSINALGTGSKGRSVIVDPEGQILQQAEQLPENLIAMLDLDRVTQARQYGTSGVSRVLASFFHEAHRFSYQQDPYHQSPVKKSISPL